MIISGVNFFSSVLSFSRNEFVNHQVCAWTTEFTYVEVMVIDYGITTQPNSYILTPPTRIKLICDHGIVISTIMFLWCSNHNYKENAISFAVYTVTISSYNLHRIMMREWSVILLYTIISHVVMDKCQVRSLRHPERPEYPPPPPPSPTR